MTVTEAERPAPLGGVVPDTADVSRSVENAMRLKIGLLSPREIRWEA
jgi:hypothetical protein